MIYGTGEYRNGKSVLPPDLFEKAARHYHGLVWIPHRRPRRIKTVGNGKRNRRIIRKYGEGKPLSRISEEECLCLERIRQIVKRSRKRK
mgnify:CR=1 FL=1